MSQRHLLLLSSSRLHGHEFLEHAKEEITSFLNKKNVKTVLFVPYAQKDYNKYTSVVSAALSPWGYNVVGIHTKPNAVEAVCAAEAIFIGGGNTFVLLKTLCEQKLVPAIRDRVMQRGVPYMGSSAGTNVATRSINTTNDMPVVYPPTFEALKLVPFNINPHYLETDTSQEHKGETRDERINEFMAYTNLLVLGLREGTALLVEGNKATLVGTRKAKLFRPNQEPVEYDPSSDLSFLLNEKR